jgi:hypothetical protein
LFDHLLPPACFAAVFRESTGICYNLSILRKNTNSLNKLQFVTRWVLLLGVMTGLCFSSGEGIQLLPFSAASGAGAQNVSQIEIGKSKFYSYSVRHSAAQSVAVKSKEQKDSAFFDAAGMSRFSAEFQPPKAFSARSSQNYHQPVLFNRSPVTAAPSDRAPPVI